MRLFQFLKSRAFLISLIIAAVLVVVVAFGALKWLKVTTKHGQEIDVPDLRKLDTDQAIQALEKSALRMVVLDTLDYNKDIPPLTVIEQDPDPGKKVKENRKIYVKINAAGYGKVIVPDMEQLTFRQALATLKALDLKEGTKSYRTFIGKDVVLEISQDGKKLKAGDKVTKASRIDFVLGDGKASPSPEELDQAPAID